MPEIYSRTLRVRSYECDIYGHVNNTVYLRYVLETALDADRASGLLTHPLPHLSDREFLSRPGVESPLSYRSEGGGSRVREGAAAVRCSTTRAQIEYLRPLRYGDTVEVRTWIAGCDGHTARRAFELVLPGAPEDPAARGYVDRILIGPHDELHAPPAEWLEAELGSQTAPLPPVDPFPELPPPPPGVFKMRRRVVWHEMETPGRTNAAACLVWIEDCGMGVIAAHGWPALRMAEQGFAILIRRNQIEYLAPARLGDELEVATYASDLKRVSAVRHYTITRVGDGAMLARVHSLGVWVDLASGRPMRIPPGFIDDFGPNLVLQAKANA